MGGRGEDEGDKERTALQVINEAFEARDPRGIACQTRRLPARGGKGERREGGGKGRSTTAGREGEKQVWEGRREGRRAEKGKEEGQRWEEWEGREERREEGIKQGREGGREGGRKAHLPARTMAERACAKLNIMRAD